MATDEKRKIRINKVAEGENMDLIIKFSKEKM